MTPEQELHLKQIQELVAQKYRSGAEAHKDSDPLMEMGPLEMAENMLSEAIDQVVYTASLVMKLRHTHHITGGGECVSREDLLDICKSEASYYTVAERVKNLIGYVAPPMDTIKHGVNCPEQIHSPIHVYTHGQTDHRVVRYGAGSICLRCHQVMPA